MSHPHHHDHSHSHSHGHDFVEANKTHHDAHGHAHDYAHSELGEWTATKIANIVLTSFPFDPETTTVLDFACGPGLISKKLASHSKRVVGVDISSSMVEEFRKQASKNGVEGKMSAVQKDILKDEEEELDGELFDVVFCAQAYHHIPDTAALSLALTRRLKQGGVLVIIDMDADSDWAELFQRRAGKDLKDKVDKVVAHKKGFTKDDLRENLRGTNRLSDITVELAVEMKVSEMQAIGGSNNFAQGIDLTEGDLTIGLLAARGVRRA